MNLRAVCVAACLIASLASRCYAVDPHRAMSQYVRERWAREQGFPRGSVYAITQTPDGYLWIGAESGLLRFDGWNFRPMRDESGSFPVESVVSLLADRDGNLWIRLRDTMTLRYRDRKFENPFSAPAFNITAMTTGKRGEFLAAWQQAGAFTFGDGALRPFARASGIPRSPVLSIAETGDGAVWLGTRGAGLFRLERGNTSPVTKGLPDPKVNCLLPDGDRGLWIGTDRGLVRWNGSEMSSPDGASQLNGLQILSMAKDRDGNLWLGTNSRGAIRLNTGGVSFLDDADTPHAAITSMFEDREGNLWFASANGIERLRDSAFVSYSLPEGLPSDGSNPVYVDAGNRMWFPPVSGGLWWMKDGRHGSIPNRGLTGDIVYSISGRKDEIWVGRQRGGLTRIDTRGATFTTHTYTTADGLAQDSIYSVYAAPDGSVWAGTLSGGVSRLRGGAFSTFTKADGLASNTVASILETSDGAVWLATPEGLSALSNNSWKTYTAADGLPSGNINCLLEDSTGMLWIGTAAGLAFRESGRFHALAAVPGSLREQILGMAEDASGSFWIATSNHVLRVSREKLKAGIVADRDVREFGLADGLRGVEGVKRHQSVFRDSYGHIWFSLNRGISVVDPSRLAADSPPAIPHIQGISADGHSVGPEDFSRIPSSYHRVEFSYAGLGLSFPDRVRFRYMMEGFDRGWSEPVSERKAAYTNLGPGSYRFRVVASNADGMWTGNEASIAFRVDPLFWQTWWFRVTVAIAILIAAAALYRWRLRLLTSRLNIRFEERLAERTRIAQDLHDTLLQGFLSASMQLHVVVDQLPQDSPATPTMSKVLALMGRVIDEGRNALHGLRSSPDAPSDLGQAFARIPRDLPEQESVSFRVVVTGNPQALHPILRDEVYRIGREAIVNAFRHSGASAIEVEVDYTARALRVVVRDDGRGIDPEVLQSGRKGHWGLTGMRERAERIGGRIHLSSSVSAGTEVEVSIPGHVAFRPSPGEMRNRVKSK